MLRCRNSYSFTLIELLVVIVIIGILAGVIMISTSSSINKATIAKLKAFEESVSNNLAASMVSRWKLDEGSGTIANDAWGSNNGTLVNFNFDANSGWVSENDCVSSKCLKFDGVDDYINLGSSITPSLSNGSVSFWRKQLYLDSWLLFRGQSSSEYFLATSGGTGNFYHSANTSGSRVIYKDGLIATAPAIDNNWHYYVISGVNLTLWTTLALNTYGGVWMYDGFLDDLRIYNAPLSASQIKQNYIAGLGALLNKGSISKEEYNEKMNVLASEN